MKQYSIDIHVEFEEPKAMPADKGSKGPWRAVGYFQYFYCSDNSKEKAKQMVIDFIKTSELEPETYRIKCERIAWIRGLTSRHQLVGHCKGGLTQEIFERRHDHGIWFHSEKQHYVGEADYAASITENDL
jgi:hypothetical protein